MIATINPREAVLNLANWLRWVTETNGANRGEAVDAIVRVTGLDPAIRAPWCACFVAACGYAVLRDWWPLKKVAGCASLAADAEQKGLLTTTPAVAAVFLLWSDQKNRYHHTGFCVTPDVTGGWITCEGNTNDSGSPEGTGVFRRARRFGPKDRFIHWWAPILPPLAAVAAPTPPAAALRAA